MNFEDFQQAYHHVCNHEELALAFHRIDDTYNFGKLDEHNLVIVDIYLKQFFHIKEWEKPRNVYSFELSDDDLMVLMMEFEFGNR